MRFENEEGKGSGIRVTSYAVPDAAIKISADNAAKLTDPGTYYNAKGNRLGEREAEKKAADAAFKLRAGSAGAMTASIDLASCQSDKTSGNVMIFEQQAQTEEGVKQAKEFLAKGEEKGVIGGFYKKRAATKGDPDVKGIYGEKTIDSFEFTDEAGAFAFSMAGAIAAAALAF